MTKHFSPRPRRRFQDFNAVLIMKPEGGISVSPRETNPVTRGDEKRAGLSPPRHPSGYEFEFFMEHTVSSLSLALKRIKDAFINTF